MSINKRAVVLAALERACRAEWACIGNPTHQAVSDAQAANWGVTTARVLRHMGRLQYVGYVATRRTLAIATADGAVLRATPRHPHVLYWPVGLLDKLQREGVRHADE